MTRTDLHSVNTFTDEAMGFLDRHPALDAQQQSFGGVVWGFMRAIAECPDCPGKFRVPLDDDWHQLYCTSCEHVWVFVDQPAEPTKPRRSRRKLA